MSCLRPLKKLFSTLRRRLLSLRRRHRRYTATSKPRGHVPPQQPTSVYVDGLFQDDPPAEVLRRPQEEVKVEAPTSSSAGGGGWKEYVESMPEIKGVDERAEEFISNFRQQMRIQRELSLLEYHEMLARSA